MEKRYHNVVLMHKDFMIALCNYVLGFYGALNSPIACKQKNVDLNYVGGNKTLCCGSVVA